MTEELLRFLTLRGERVPLETHQAVRTRNKDPKYIDDDPPFDAYLGLQFYHADPLPWLLQRNEKFVDEEFPLSRKTIVCLRGDGSNSSTASMLPGILTSSNCRDFNAAGPRKTRRIQHYVRHAQQWTWIRASDMMKQASLFATDHSVDPRNVLQGQVGNCGLCSAIASLAAEAPDLIRSSFGAYSEKSLSSIGALSVLVFLPQGQPRYVLLDDYLLCRKNDCRSSPSMHSPLSGDLWIRLLEKALIKIQGSLASLDELYKYKSLYRHSALALQLLTGAPIAMELQFAGSTTEYVYNVLTTTQGSFARVVHCRSNDSGLHSHHGYSLLWIGQA